MIRVSRQAVMFFSFAAFPNVQDFQRSWSVLFNHTRFSSTCTSPGFADRTAKNHNNTPEQRSSTTIDGTATKIVMIVEFTDYLLAK
ncbi:MAG: hypothetical protein M2R45_03879 [Verrucomicrobia subdivision 3 bacterium]|nr:hypothetical protein [Limisphaerales bacterium]MCS1412583.1 hypothetical protein [Limisphaerales bacterium]